MRPSLSPRLLACCDFVTSGERVADVGCDHGYLSIYLLKSGIASSVLASDIRPGPLQAAIRNAQKYGVSDRLRFFLSDGLHELPRDFDTLVCAGMGADVMISILEAAPWLRTAEYRLVLQCQSKMPLLRKYLTETGWKIADEVVVRDGRFLYTVMQVFWGPGQPLTPGQCWLSPALLAHPSELTEEYCHRTLQLLQTSVNGKGAQADPLERAALEELTRNPFQEEPQ